MRPGRTVLAVLGRFAALLLLCALALQLVFVARIAMMRWVDPASTAMQRSELHRLLGEGRPLRWSQQWLPRERIAASLQRAVIASEDAGFVGHGGIEWAAIEQAWGRNQRERERAEQRALAGRAARAARVVGGSTITQQLAKNLLLSGERRVLRKAQEAVIALALEALLDKGRILELYLNHVEWGQGIFGAQAAALRYHRVDAGRLPPAAAARLAVMLPAPKRFERQGGSAYLDERSATILRRMPAVDLP